MVSLRAALNRRIGNETRPKVRWPFHTLDAISTLLRTDPQNQATTIRYYKKRGVGNLHKMSCNSDGSNRPTRGKSGRWSDRMHRRDHGESAISAYSHPR